MFYFKLLYVATYNSVKYCQNEKLEGDVVSEQK